MKALTIRQPWASLVVHGVKHIETRTRPAPAALIGQRIGIIAGKHRPKDGEAIGDWHYHRVPGDWPIAKGVWRSDSIWSNPTLSGVDAPRGALIGSVELVECLPILDGDRRHDEYPRDCLFVCKGGSELWRDSDCLRPLDDQLPYGDFTPGRWAWLLRDPQPCTPVPMRGALHWQEVEL